MQKASVVSRLALCAQGQAVLLAMHRGQLHAQAECRLWNRVGYWVSMKLDESAQAGWTLDPTVFCNQDFCEAPIMDVAHPVHSRSVVVALPFRRRPLGPWTLFATTSTLRRVWPGDARVHWSVSQCLRQVTIAPLTV